MYVAPFVAPLTASAAFVMMTSGTAAPAPGPYQVFAHAQRVWESARYPDVVRYVVHVQTVRGEKHDERHYSSEWFAGTNSLVVDPVSTEEREHPYVPPPGVDVNIVGLKTHVGGPKEGSGTNGDLIGVPELSPNYSFGIARYRAPEPPTPAELVAKIRRDFHDPAPEKVSRLESGSGLKTIAVVSTERLEYAISLAGIEPWEGHDDYHLVLRPLSDPHKYRLRDVWINTQSFETDKARTQGNFVDGGTSSVPWTTTFQSLGGVQYIAKEQTDEPIAHWFDSISVAFEDFQFTQARFAGTPASGSPIREP